ncbi:hypothetical protein BG015_001650 [Linnemannia schmuckeri]|uniref:FAD-binding domain-containing protein n=1 Tax=Linnemannia schmuckeri TaxID=64567 RepID=A0A9P5S3U3_9FUNG|nr:hypothetical protein BG015_001650 [Linnemannia schmuckeri]
MPFGDHETEYGTQGYIVTRPQLYDLLVRQFPKERIHLGKKVMSTENGDNNVLIRFNYGTEAKGDILLGADSAYSASTLRATTIRSATLSKLTVQFLLDNTPKGQISKVKLEEKVFKTWYSDRTVLIGDAQSRWRRDGTNVLHDAIVLADLINGLPFYPDNKEIEAVFKTYQDERMPWVLEASKASNVHRNLVGQVNLSQETCPAGCSSASKPEVVITVPR